MQTNTNAGDQKMMEKYQQELGQLLDDVLQMLIRYPDMPQPQFDRLKELLDQIYQAMDRIAAKG